MTGQTFLKGPLRFMSQISKDDCITVDQAMKEANVSRGTFYNYMNYLNVQRHKFPFDRKAYILLRDLDRIRQFVKETRG